jgi:hydrogenase-4 membrane subunit HyfE
MPDLPRPVVPLLRAVLVLAAAAIVLLMSFSIPGALAESVRQEPRFSTERWVLLAVAEVELACVLVVVVAVWRLLGRVASDRIFSEESFRAVDLILAALGVAWLVWLAFSILVLATSDDPGNPIAAAVVGLAITVVALLMLVMRALLRQATELRTDMDAVI